MDVDAVADRLGSYRGENSPDDISRGLRRGDGHPRLLRYDLRTSWFIPGHSLETFPEQTQMVVDAGHEIGVHGYSHEITGHPGVRWLTLDEIARDFGHRRPGPDA